MSAVTFALMKMTELCLDDRPREKMLDKGPSALSNAELLAIMIRTGTGKMNAVDVASHEIAIFAKREVVALQPNLAFRAVRFQEFPEMYKIFFFKHRVMNVLSLHQFG